MPNSNRPTLETLTREKLVGNRIDKIHPRTASSLQGRRRANHPIKAPEGIEYYDLIKNWRKVKRHLRDPELNDILVGDFNKFTEGCLGKKFTHGQLPRDFETIDWVYLFKMGVWVGHGYRGGHEPGFWRYVKYEACHWLVNFALRLAQLVEPEKPWRILTSREHSTVWDGDKLLFEFNFQAFEISPAECFRNARCARWGRELKVGKNMRIDSLATVEAQRRKRRERRRERLALVPRTRPFPADGKVVPTRPKTERKRKQLSA